jgi:ribosomal protein S18 acetylase RimI-like enzyme
VQPVSSALFEQHLFSKQTFDPAGVIVACDDERPIGFVHGGFGPNDAGNGLDYSLGVTLMLRVIPEFESPELSRDLLAASEAYLRGRGATVLYGGGMKPLDPFYLGLYGGSELSGVLGSDTRLNEVFQQNGYEVATEAVVLHHELARSRPSFSREQRLLGRETQFDQNYNPRAENWWEVNRLGEIDRQHFRLTPRRTHETLAIVEFWDIEPLASSWGLRVAGVRDLYVDPQQRRRKLASYLLSECFKLLRKKGVSLIEAHVMKQNDAAMNLYRGLDFTPVDTGIVYRKPG